MSCGFTAPQANAATSAVSYSIVICQHTHGEISFLAHTRGRARRESGVVLLSGSSSNKLRQTHDYMRFCHNNVRYEAE